MCVPVPVHHFCTGVRPHIRPVRYLPVIDILAGAATEYKYCVHAKDSNLLCLSTSGLRTYILLTLRPPFLLFPWSFIVFFEVFSFFFFLFLHFGLPFIWIHCFCLSLSDLFNNLELPTFVAAGSDSLIWALDSLDSVLHNSHHVFVSVSASDVLLYHASGSSPSSSVHELLHPAATAVLDDTLLSATTAPHIPSS